MGEAGVADVVSARIRHHRVGKVQVAVQALRHTPIQGQPQEVWGGLERERKREREREEEGGRIREGRVALYQYKLPNSVYILRCINTL